MSIRISFECPWCNSRLRSTSQFIGRTSQCPGCRQEIMIPPQTPEEEAPLLVMDDGDRREA